MLLKFHEAFRYVSAILLMFSAQVVADEINSITCIAYYFYCIGAVGMLHFFV